MATPSFKSLLQKNGVTIADTTNAIKKLAQDYDILEQSIPTIRTELKKKDLTEAKKKELTADLAEAEEALPIQDTKLVTAITAWLPNRQKIKERTDRMLAGKNAKNASKGAATTSAPSAEPAKPEPPKPPAAAASAAPAAASSSSKPAAAAQTPAVQSKEQRSGSPLLGVLLAFGGGIAAGFGLTFLFKTK